MRQVLGGIKEWGRYAPILTHYTMQGYGVAFNKLLKWKDTVTKRTFTIELKLDIGNEDETLEPMIKIVKQHARDLLATSTLLAAHRQSPKVAVFTDDAMFTTHEIELKPEDEEQEDEDEEVTEEVTDE